ncbi:MAG TPA: hypothetical protein VNN18_10745 [Candidatus Xenobia bacterium]|nr:hypothetical protein [Candidatus Xenobia bacterium]
MDQIKPGMRGKAYTIFAGPQIESFDLEVLGVLPNLLGPKLDVILVRLLGDKPNYTGVVSGMSGSPVYIDGKLVGALSLRFGAFTKEPIGGVTPIATMLRAGEFAEPSPGKTAETTAHAPPRYRLPEEFASAAGLPRGLDPYLVPIDMPLTFVGFHPQTIHRFAEPLGQMGFVAVQGGGTAAPGAGGALEPGGAVSAALVTGDMTIAGTCTISYRKGDQLYACGHPILGVGQVTLPMARAEIVTTVPSELGSFKIANIGEVIGQFEQDRRSAIVGRVGPAPPLVPVELTLVARGRSTQYRYNIFQHPKFSPLLMDITLFNGLQAAVESSEEMTYRVTGRLELAGHSDVVLDDMFSPTDSFVPDALWVVASVSDTFRRIFGNSFETPKIERIHLKVELLPRRLSATIENAWASKSEVRPGETVSVKVVLRPYRGERIVQDIPMTIPPQATKGDLRILVSDATLLNRLTTSLLLGPAQQFPGAFQARLTSLDQLISLLNRERRNDHLYVSIFQSTPTVLLEDKILPSVPLSQINVLNDDTTVPRQGSPLYFPQSILTEANLPLGQVITGSHWLTLTVR